MRNCYYVDSRGPDSEQFQWAVKMFFSKIKAKEIIIAVPYKCNLEGPVRAYFGDVIITELLSANKVIMEKTKFFLVTKNSGPVSSFSGAAIMIYPSRDLLDKIDDLTGVTDVLMVPWSDENIYDWAPRWNAIEIISQKRFGFVTLSVKVQERIDTLDSAVNSETGLRHPSDRCYAIKLFKSMKSEGLTINPVEIKNYLIARKNWSARNANMVFNVAEKVLKGSLFRNRG
ncbi:MAG TPA: hypothetical protein PKG52_11095 [bacterium]|nr:hypothetical protein [bacterium]HPS28933.1 hypothetical protein [bacterium]